MPQLYSHFVPACTYDGDNHILMLQTAKYLMKLAGLAAKGETLAQKY